jgi:hypothetical protein
MEMDKMNHKDHCDTPILFITFKRPDTTRKVFEEIRKAKPKKLFLAQNYPRGKKFEDTENWKEVRSIIENIDWDCEIKRLYRDYYLEVKVSVSSALDWFFSHVEEGIILEDDCVPDQSFFPFCQELLEKYRDDKRIMMISGDNFQFGRNGTKDSYYFSRYFHIWGWATWKRAWKYYDVDMKVWPEICDNGYLNNILLEKSVVKYWESVFNLVYNGVINTWDYQWVFSCWIQGGLSIMPNQNLVSNIGFDMIGTHTKGDSIFSKMATKNMKFPLMHPDYMIRDLKADKYTEKIWFSNTESLKNLLKLKFNILINKLKQ